MSNFVVDVEADGPCPGLYSMVCFGAVKVDDHSQTFYGRTKPISQRWIPEALNVSGYTRDQHKNFSDPILVMKHFAAWVKHVNSNGRPIMWSDNIAFDWQFINYYFHLAIGENPFGFSGRRIGDYYAGLMKDPFVRWKHLRTTKHDHNPVNDAKGNAEALNRMGIE